MFSGWPFMRHPPFCKFYLQRYDEYFDFARKMGDNIKKVANLFVIFDFCSIWIDSHNPLNFRVLSHFLSDFLASSNLSSYLCCVSYSFKQGAI